MTDYDDILNTEWPPKERDLAHRPMPVSQRAKIFLPFAALTGYEQVLDETLLIQLEGMDGLAD